MDAIAGQLSRGIVLEKCFQAYDSKHFKPRKFWKEGKMIHCPCISYINNKNPMRADSLNGKTEASQNQDTQSIGFNKTFLPIL